MLSNSHIGKLKSVTALGKSVPAPRTAQKE
jgi:hypothetical protein